MGHAVKIIEIAEGNQTFVLNEGALKKILHSVPEGMEIAIISVVRSSLVWVSPTHQQTKQLLLVQTTNAHTPLLIINR